MALDSEAVFEARLKAVGLEDVHIQKAREAGWRTLAEFAFSSSYVPGQVGDSTFVNEVVIVVLGDANHVKRSALRRVFFEAYTAVAADLKRRLEKTDEEPPRRLPLAERSARVKALQDRLQGLELTGELECSHALVDKAAQMIEDDNLSYIPWEACTKRSQELEGQRVLKEYRPTATGYLKEVARADRAVADVSTDLRLNFALQRRSIALDIANVLSFHEHEKFVNKIIGELLRIPPQGYKRVSLDQLMRLDRELWNSLAQRTRQGLKRPADGSNPLDAIFMPTFQEASVQLLLLPLPSSSESSRTSAATQDDAQVSKRALKRLASIAGFGHFPIDASCLNDTAPELQRLVALVSMAPRSKAPEDVLVKRRGAYVGEQTTSHWPFRFDADAPTEKPTKRDADLTPAMRRLIG